MVFRYCFFLLFWLYFFLLFSCDENIDECTSWSGQINRIVLSMVRLYRSVNTYWLNEIRRRYQTACFSPVCIVVFIPFVCCLQCVASILRSFPLSLCRSFSLVPCCSLSLSRSLIRWLLCRLFVCSREQQLYSHANSKRSSVILTENRFESRTSKIIWRCGFLVAVCKQCDNTLFAGVCLCDLSLFYFCTSTHINDQHAHTANISNKTNETALDDN